MDARYIDWCCEDWTLRTFYDYVVQRLDALSRAMNIPVAKIIRNAQESVVNRSAWSWLVIISEVPFYGFLLFCD
jgi:hypothetical protein